MRCSRGRVLLFLIVLVAGTSAHAFTESISGTIPATSNNEDIATLWGVAWSNGNLLCQVVNWILEIIPTPSPPVKFQLQPKVPGGTTASPHSYQLDVTYDETAEAFTLVELTIGATTTDITQPGVYSFPEIDVVSNRVPLAQGIPALGGWATIGTVAGLLLLGGVLVVRRVL